MARLFGTDGVRGVANQELSLEMAVGLGQAIGDYTKQNVGQQQKRITPRPRILIGKDTRVSGDMLEAGLTAGITSMGVDVVQIGVIPTPGVAFLCRHMGFEAGVMISASHNPVEDNGIKFFDNQGFKLPDDVEDRIETIYWEREKLERPTGVGVGRVQVNREMTKIYEDYLFTSVPIRFEGLRVVVDCGFGAAYQLAPKVLERLGADVISLHSLNDGSRINVRCGSTHPGILKNEVVVNGAHLGIAHDGDADRLIAVDENGKIVDGDQIITICGLDLLKHGKLRNNKVAVTVYSNLGVKQAFRKHGADVVVTPNGDRYVLEALREHGLILGGEQSGHIIFLDRNSTGDGILTALQLITVLIQSNQKLSELAHQMERFPQVQESVRVSRKEGWEQNPNIQNVVHQVEEALKDNGRLLVRASGTEPLIRVMAEGPDEAELHKLVKMITSVIQKELG